MGAICSTAQPAPKKRETKFDVTKSPPGSPNLNHKASLKGWLDGLDVAGDTKRNLHDIYSVDKRPLGHGATSTVYKCTKKSTGENFACKRVDKRKMIALYSSQRGTIAARMRAEIEISMKLKHENLIRVEDIFETGSHVFVIMEMMQGGELFDYVIEHSNLKESEASAIIKQVASALKFMHDNGIIHRDLKPENVMLSKKPDGKRRKKPFIKIIDFGMSKALSPGRNAQSCLGTPGYMAPEVLEHKDYTSSVDMYSLGVVSYILLAGYMPLQTAEGTWHSRVIYPAEEWAEVSDDAKDFINQLVTYDPKKRMNAQQALQHKWLSKLKTRRDSTLQSSRLLANPLSRKDLQNRRSSALIDIENEDLKADVEAIKAMQEELEKRNSKFVQSPRADDEAEETKEEVKGGDQEGQQEEGAKKEKKFYV